MRVWSDGNLLDAGQAGASPLSHALHYGTGVFEGIRAYPTADGPAIFRLDAHLARLGRGAEVLGMGVDLTELRRGCVEVLQDSGLDSAYLRPLVYYGTGGLGLDVAPLEVRRMVAAIPWNNHLGEGISRGIRVCVSSLRRNPARSLPPLKLCGNYVNSILAKLEATNRGFEEALFVDEQGCVVECTGENVFMVNGGRVTAVAHDDALPGITRETILEISGGVNRIVDLEELLGADEVFVTGTSAEVTPVAELGDRTWTPGPVTRDLQAQYLDIVHGRTTARQGWLTWLPNRQQRPLAPSA